MKRWACLPAMLLTVLPPGRLAAPAEIARDQGLAPSPGRVGPLAAAAPIRAVVASARVELYDVHTRERARFLLPRDGIVGAEQARALEAFFRCARTQRHKPMAPGALALLADVGIAFPGRTIEIVSGYRSPPYGVRHSKHFAGHAIDLRVRGVRTAVVRDHVWRAHRHVGVGYYRGQDFIHVDHRPGEPDVAWTSTREGAPNRYHPWWAEKARK